MVVSLGFKLPMIAKGNCQPEFAFQAQLANYYVSSVAENPRMKAKTCPAGRSPIAKTLVCQSGLIDSPNIGNGVKWRH
jgi:hypothetical protein